MRLSTGAAFAFVLTLLVTPAAAQSTTEDGIRAVLRGDYRAAAGILKPLADDAARPDPAAQFFLAVLYHTGEGLTRDESRACGLFLNAATREHPFAEQSGALAASMREQLGAGAALMCVAEERWQGGPPLSFSLGPGHRIVFADTSITVTHGGQEQRTLILLPAGARFLPIQHTPLAVTRPFGTRRAFFQLFYWTPDPKNPSSWTLGWTLSEVVGDLWVGITGEQNLLVVQSPTQPARSDLDNLVRLQVNASGEAEFTVLGGASPRTEAIPWHGPR